VQEEQLKQQHAQAMIQSQQENQLKQLQDQKTGTPTQVEQQQQQQQTSQQQDEHTHTQQGSSILQAQDAVSEQHEATGQQDVSLQQEDTHMQQQDVTAQQQQTNIIPQQEVENGGFTLPQVIDVRHSVIPQSETAQALQSQVRSLNSEVSSPQRTLAVYRTSYGMRGGSNFITFNSPYAHYTIS
ncbi:hypothetical protein KUF71_015193, partial [Frankliniella fusca]